MNTIGKVWMSAVVAMFCFFGLAACGGGGGGSTPVTPTAIYGGAATQGDLFVLKMDYPSTGKATVTQSATDGSVIETQELSYTASGHTYTFTDSDANTFTGYFIPDAMFVMQTPDREDILVAVDVDISITTAAQLAFLKDREYILTQFRHDRKGVKWVWSIVNADGAITGHHANADNALPIDLQDTSTTDDFAPGQDVDNLVYNANTLGFTLSTEDEGTAETWTFYYTAAGIGVIDKGPLKGIRFNTPKGTSTNPADYGIVLNDVYDTVFYGSNGEADHGTSVGTVTITNVEANAFSATVNDGRGGTQTIRAVAAGEPWIGFFMIDGANAVVQPVGSGAFVFAGKQGEWNYNYGIGVK